MDGDGTEDAFEFNLTRVLESLDQRGPTLGDLSALSTPLEPTAAVDASMSPEPLLISPLSDDQPEPLAPLPHRVPTARGSQQTRRAPRAQRSGVAEPPAPEPLPTRVAARAAMPEVAPPARSSVFDAAAQGEARAALHRVPVYTDVAAAAAAEPAPLLPAPLLPPAAAAAPPEAAAVQSTVKMPTASEVRQFQSTQRRQARKNSQGRVMGRVMLVMVLFAAAVAAALTVGRDYLFPNDWATELDESVDEVQAARGVEFEQVVPLTDQPADEYAATLSRVVLGDDPAARVAVWRALGIASGEIDMPSLGATLATAQPAVYDAENAEIVRLAGAPAELRPLLAAALDHQISDQDSAGGLDLLGPLPVAFASEPAAPTDAVVSADASVPADVGAPADLTAPAHVANPGAVVPAEPAVPVTALPVMYQTLAAERLATALAANPTASLDDALGTAPEAALAPGDVPLAGPFGLGIDDWMLVWGNRLPADSVDTLVAATAADSIRTFERAGTICVGAVFEAGNELFAAALLLDLGAWAAAAPAESQATATQLAPTYVQLTTCDPGAAVPQGMNPAAVDIVVAAQLARIARAAAPPASDPPG